MLTICQHKGHAPICFEDMDCPACEIIAEKDKEIKDLEENIDDVIHDKERLQEHIDELEEEIADMKRKEKSE